MFSRTTHRRRAAPRSRARREYEYSETHHAHHEGQYHHKHHGLFGRHTYHRANPKRRAGGYKAALSNPNTTHDGRRHAKHELKRMGRGREAHVPIMTRVKRLFGVRSHPHRRHDRHYY